MLATVIGIALGVGVVGLGLGAFLRARSKEPRWVPLGSVLYPGARCAGYLGAAVLDRELLARCLECAADRLMARTWTPAQVRAVALNVQIQVMPVAKWQQMGGADSVAGEAEGNVARIGSDYLALAHELAHLVEARVSGRADASHASWERRGIRLAEAEYEAWVRELG